MSQRGGLHDSSTGLSISSSLFLTLHFKLSFRIFSIKTQTDSNLTNMAGDQNCGQDGS